MTTKVEKSCTRCFTEKRPKDFLDDSPTCKDCSMRVVTVDSIKDFQVCSLFYDYRYNKSQSEPTNNRTIMAQRFRNTFIRVLNFYLYKKQSGIEPSYNALVNRWQRLWFPKEMDAYDMLVEKHTISHGNLAKYSNIAVQSLKQFHEDFSSVKIDPMLIQEEYMVPIGSEVILSGTIDFMYRQNGEYNVVMWTTEKKRLSLASLQMEFAALKLAYDHRRTHTDKVNYHFYDLGSERPGLVKVNHEDIMTGVLEFWSNEMLNQKYVPRRGQTAYCKGCPFDDQCKSFSFNANQQLKAIG